MAVRLKKVEGLQQIPIIFLINQDESVQNYNITNNDNFNKIIINEIAKMRTLKKQNEIEIYDLKNCYMLHNLKIKTNILLLVCSKIGNFSISIKKRLNAIT